jgi:hypothetical protein
MNTINPSFGSKTRSGVSFLDAASSSANVEREYFSSVNAYIPSEATSTLLAVPAQFADMPGVLTPKFPIPLANKNKRSPEIKKVKLGEPSYSHRLVTKLDNICILFVSYLKRKLKIDVSNFVVISLGFIPNLENIEKSQLYISCNNGDKIEGKLLNELFFDFVKSLPSTSANLKKTEPYKRVNLSYQPKINKGTKKRKFLLISGNKRKDPVQLNIGTIRKTENNLFYMSKNDGIDEYLELFENFFKLINDKEKINNCPKLNKYSTNQSHAELNIANSAFKSLENIEHKSFLFLGTSKPFCADCESALKNLANKYANENLDLICSLNISENHYPGHLSVNQKGEFVVTEKCHVGDSDNMRKPTPDSSPDLPTPAPTAILRGSNIKSLEFENEEHHDASPVLAIPAIRKKLLNKLLPR